MIRMSAMVNPSEYNSFESIKSRNKRARAVKERQKIKDQMQSLTADPHLYSNFDDTWLNNSKIRNTMGLQNVWDALSKKEVHKPYTFTEYREDNHLVPTVTDMPNTSYYETTNEVNQAVGMTENPMSPQSKERKTVRFGDQLNPIGKKSLFANSTLFSSKSTPAMMKEQMSRYDQDSFGDTLDRETMKHTLLNSRRDNFSPEPHQEIKQIEQSIEGEYDPYEPEPLTVTYGMGPKTSIILQLYEDCIIRFDTVNQTFSDFPLNGVLGTISPAYSQVNENELVMTGGIEKYRTNRISPRTMLYNVRTCKLFRLKDMLTPRKGHTMVTVDYYCYCMGGSTEKSQYTAIVERLNLLVHEWESLNSLCYPRATPKAVVSNKYKRIYIFGGCKLQKDNYFVEEFDINNIRDIDFKEKPSKLDFEVNNENKSFCKIMESTLYNPFDSTKDHVVLVDDNVFFSAEEDMYQYDITTMSLPSTKFEEGSSWVTENEKIFVFQYENLLHPFPLIYTLNIKKDVIKEIDYNKLSSEACSYHKKAMVYDKYSSSIYAFSELEPENYDYLDLNLFPLAWLTTKFQYL
ncbi:unnamed protein product [Moneuplotes crassus]|uniref:Uncharacterized protein n=1 Tax=Euplotes crassus TaxID=5936 RepID=A0AAD1X998_EUPCR|nr:unnamed protein product [Moneuplotes crassus]